jgi:hypothetical protein
MMIDPDAVEIGELYKRALGGEGDPTLQIGDILPPEYRPLSPSLR